MARSRIAEALRRRFDVSRETIDRLATYESLLASVAEDDQPRRAEHARRHLAPPFRRLRAALALSAARGAEPGSILAPAPDFPGLVLAIMLVRTATVAKYPRRKRYAQGRLSGEVARRTGMRCGHPVQRIENAETRAKVGAVDCVTARALAPLPRLVELAAPYFASSTLGLFLKGREVEAEIEEAARRWQFAYELKPSMTDEGQRRVAQALKPKDAWSKTGDNPWPLCFRRRRRTCEYACRCHRQSEGRRRQDDDRHQPRHRAGRRSARRCWSSISTRRATPRRASASPSKARPKTTFDVLTGRRHDRSMRAADGGAGPLRRAGQQRSRRHRSRA